MLLREVTICLNDLAAAISKLRFVESELQRARQEELKKRREKPSELGPDEPQAS
jgi:hypothetical protein